ncbi:acyl-CoA dehydrogenase family protein [Natrinema caseinilyticum]|uniref:acyl-CoA dehydrogenase family protein n=1 Tax=Natrinema caseinilyticum TaxID=2961570 RepID=UPI0020C486DD|nr:acyl-CoA dehydrogenase family protein [Natrinema caseinilyticum]
MTFDRTAEERMIYDSVTEALDGLDEAYWREHDAAHEFPSEFWDRLDEGGWLGLRIPEEYGGAGGSMREELTMVKAMTQTGAGYGAAFVYIVHSLVTIPLVRNGTEAQKETYLPKLANGELNSAFFLTEPQTGFDTLSMETTAEKDGDEWVIRGEKTYISNASRADLMLVMARTSEPSGDTRTDGMSMFLVDRNAHDVDIEVTPLDKLGLNYTDTSHVYINEIRVPEGSSLGPIDDGWPSILDILNPERMIVAAACIGAGNYVLDLASDYASDRVVFDRPIGKNQGVQFPLAEAKIHLETADAANRKAAWKYDHDEPCGFESNAANFVASEWGTKAANRAIQTLGGSGYMKDSEVERFWREMRLQEIAPVSQQMILNYVGEHVLDLPKSY